jgi:hypothetical protein
MPPPNAAVLSVLAFNGPPPHASNASTILARMRAALSSGVRRIHNPVVSRWNQQRFGSRHDVARAAAIPARHALEPAGHPALGAANIRKLLALDACVDCQFIGDPALVVPAKAVDPRGLAIGVEHGLGVGVRSPSVERELQAGAGCFIKVGLSA